MVFLIGVAFFAMVLASAMPVFRSARLNFLVYCLPSLALFFWLPLQILPHY